MSLRKGLNDFYPLHQGLAPNATTLSGHSIFPLWKKILFSVDTKQASNDLRQVTGHNVQLTQDSTDNSLVMQATTNDPILSIDNIPFEKGKLYVLHVEMESPENSQLQIFPSNQDPSIPFPDKKYSETYQTRKGSNVFYIPLFSGNLGIRLRFDPGKKSGLYRLKTFEIREVNSSSLKELK